MRDQAELIEFYRSYGDSSFATDMPAYAEICRNIGDHPELVALVGDHEPDAQQPNLLFAAVHYLLLAGLDHPLTAAYDGSSQQAPTPLFADLVLSNRETIDEILTHKRTQTNEVGRCALLAWMLNDAQQRSGQQLAWIDLGASGGLNLNLDEYSITYEAADGDTTTTGDSDAAVKLRCKVRAGSPSLRTAHADIGWRLGVDRAPIDVTDPDQARWLKACLWPNQLDRLDRLDAAIAVAQARPYRVEHADAVAGVIAAIAQAPADAALVVTTTWVWYYLPEPTQQAVLTELRDSGRKVWWYSLEGRGVVAELGQGPGHDVSASQVGLLEVGGERADRAELFGEAHPHGAWLAWHS